MTNFWDLPKPVREKIYRLHLRFTTPVKYETFKELSGGTQAAADGTKVQKIMPLLLQVLYRLELEGGFGHAYPTHYPLSFTDVTNSLSYLLWRKFDPDPG